MHRLSIHFYCFSIISFCFSFLSKKRRGRSPCLFSVSKNLVEFRPAGRNKMEIHFIRRLCRPEKYISPRKCGICAPKAHKLCAQSRRSPFCQESVSFFDSITGMRSGASLLFFVQQEIGKASCRIAECVAVFPRQRHAALRCVVQRHQCHLLFKSARHALIEHRDPQPQLDHG